MSFDILRDEIKQGKVRNLYLFYGPEEYLKEYYLNSIEKLILNKETVSLNKVLLDAKADIDKIIDNCEAMPVFSEKKLVIVKKSGLFKSKKSGERATADNSSYDRLALFLQKLPEHTCLIFYEDEIDKRVKLADAVKKSGLLVEFPFQKPAELVIWVIKVFKSYNKEIDVEQASYLVDNCEQGMTELLNEINKLVLFLGDRKKVQKQDVESVCSALIKGRIFDLTEAIAVKDSVRAFKILNDLVTLKEPLPKILFMITRQYRQLMTAKLLTEKGSRPEEIARELGVTPYIASKIARQADSFSIDELKQIIEESLEMDIAIKTGKMNDRMAVEILLAKHTAK